MGRSPRLSAHSSAPGARQLYPGGAVWPAERRGRGEITEIKDLLKDLTDRVIGIEMGSGVAAVANQLINTRLRAVELERKIRETEDLEERIEELERGQAKPAGVWRGAHR